MHLMLEQCVMSHAVQSEYMGFATIYTMCSSYATMVELVEWMQVKFILHFVQHFTQDYGLTRTAFVWEIRWCVTSLRDEHFYEDICVQVYAVCIPGIRYDSDTNKNGTKTDKTNIRPNIIIIFFSLFYLNWIGAAEVLHFVNTFFGWMNTFPPFRFTGKKKRLSWRLSECQVDVYLCVVCNKQMRTYTVDQCRHRHIEWTEKGIKFHTAHIHTRALRLQLHYCFVEFARHLQSLTQME